MIKETIEEKIGKRIPDRIFWKTVKDLRTTPCSKKIHDELFRYWLFRNESALSDESIEFLTNASITFKIAMVGVREDA